MYLLDTSAIIEVFDATKTGAEIVMETMDSQIFITAITEFELLAIRNPKKREITKKLLKNIPVLEFDSKCAGVSSEIMHKMMSKGKFIDEMDIIIAGTCIRNNLFLLTLDKHFVGVPDLNVKRFT